MRQAAPKISSGGLNLAAGAKFRTFLLNKVRNIFCLVIGLTFFDDLPFFSVVYIVFFFLLIPFKFVLF